MGTDGKKEVNSFLMDDEPSPEKDHRMPHKSILTLLLLTASAWAQDSTTVAATPVTPAVPSVADSAPPKVSAPAPVTSAPIVSTPVADTAKTKRKSMLKRLPPVAVLSFSGTGMDAKDLAAVTNRFEAELLATDSFKIVERRNIDKILKEQGFQQSGACDNSECSVEIGHLLSVQGIFTGELSRTGKTWSLSVKRTDVGSGQTQFSHVLDIEGSLEDVLRGGAPEMALIASGRKKSENNHTVLVAKKEGSLWP